MAALLGRALGVLTAGGRGGGGGCFCSALRAAAGVPFRVPAVFTAGLRIFPQPEKFDDVIIPTKNKLKFVSKVPNYKKARKWTKQLSDIRGPARGNTTFTNGKFGIVALGGGYLHWGHMEMMRLAINRKMDSKNMFARWRVRAPYKPLTRKGLGQRMGGGKGAIDHYVTPVKYGQLVVEVGGRAEFTEAESWLVEVANKLPFPAKAVSSEQLEEMQKTEEWRMENNENPWTFKRIVDNNMLGLRFTLSPYDIRYFGRFWGKFKLPS
ncbi:large ribosomal subunit protein uL16m isoform X1 [Lethenteron reissneri]|uniref:large ribosomal subunit protein uL16m isoform X1 n=1 Tax=Lethenteron reissneri TaxID=7753 RepID=UPI002AB620D6|nr:large ribosomal subunit protein uL16m isoform X1 [Lethenteron reissneri]